MTTDQNYRSEHDSMGEVNVPKDALYGAQTQRAVDNFPISGLTMPRSFIRAMGLIKAAAADTNAQLGELEKAMAEAIIAAAEKVASGEVDQHFPVDVFQTGSGTSTNMNANEVIARLASEQLGSTVHPNDHVNRGQSSNDVIPTAIHVSAMLDLAECLLPALKYLKDCIQGRADELSDTVKTGRTHLMDAMPVTLGQELGGWATQIEHGIQRIETVFPRLSQLAQGGTAVGTGINAHPEFAQRFARVMSKKAGIQFAPSDDKFESLSAQDAAVELSGQLKTVAVSMMKIANDLRWMNSGPLTGLSEIALPALQPGSSIMPGKVNPVIPEAVAMVCAQVIGNDTTITVAGQSGNFQLNVMLPVIAYNLLQSIELLSNSATNLADQSVSGFTVNHQKLSEKLDLNPVLVTALNEVIGYEKGASIAKQAYQKGRPIIEVAAEVTQLSMEELKKLLDPRRLTHPHDQK
ncbi:MAG: class II fumarate hydratase [Gammaproteobacteria bacterium]|jgi:fumarate hydratase class II